MRKLFTGTPGAFEVLEAEQPVSNFSFTLFSPEYGCVGYWKGAKDWHKDCNWLLTKADAVLFSQAKPMLEMLQDIAESAVLNPEQQNAVLALIDKALEV